MFSDTTISFLEGLVVFVISSQLSRGEAVDFWFLKAFRRRIWDFCSVIQFEGTSLGIFCHSSSINDSEI